MSQQRPKAIFSEDGKRITVDGPSPGVSHIFELVDAVPLGYIIWNIGENMADGYLPLCRLCAIQPFPGGRSIEPDTLKAVKCDGAQIILEATSCSGANTAEKMEKYIQKYRNAKPGTWEHTNVKRIKEALPYVRQIKWR